MTNEFPAASFGCVVGVSSIEHICLGHYDGDPLDVDGDRHCMEHVVRWLKPGGWVYADVPYGPVYRVEGTSHRVYDETSLSRLLVPGLTLQQRWWTTWADHDHVMHDTPDGLSGMVYVALLARKD